MNGTTQDKGLHIKFWLDLSSSWCSHLLGYPLVLPRIRTIEKFYLVWVGCVYNFRRLIQDLYKTALSYTTRVKLYTGNDLFPPDIICIYTFSAISLVDDDAVDGICEAILAPSFA